MIDITQYDAVGDGKTNCSPAIAKALEKETELYFPPGIYAITEELQIPSHRHLCLNKEAVIFAADNCFNKAGITGVITNKDHINGNEDIVIEGGKIDANNIHNCRADWKHGPNSGLTFFFKRMKKLRIKNLISHNADAYNIGLCRVEDFVIEDIVFTSTYLTRCQDGVHVGGFCCQGVIRNIKAEYGCTNDDLIAFNADDILSYTHNSGMEDGPISDMLVENVSAENCWSAVRILSVKSQISNVTVRNLSAGVRCRGLNLDACQGAETTLFKKEDYPNGVGRVKNILLENITLWRADRIWQENVLDRQGKIPLAVDSFRIKLEAPDFNIFETHGDITIRNLVRDCEKDCNPSSPFIRFDNLYHTTVTANGDTFVLQGECKCLDGDRYDMIIKPL